MRSLALLLSCAAVLAAGCSKEPESTPVAAPKKPAVAQVADRDEHSYAEPQKVAIADLALDFPRPRDTRLVTSADFVRLKRHCLELLDHDDGRQLPRLTPLGLPPGITPDRLRIAI